MATPIDIAELMVRFGADASQFNTAYKLINESLKKAGVLAEDTGQRFDASQKRMTTAASSGASARIGISQKEADQVVASMERVEAARRAQLAQMEQTAQRIRSIGSASSTQRQAQLRQQAQEEEAAAAQRLGTIREVANADIAAANEQTAARNAALAEQSNAFKTYAAEQQTAYASMQARAEAAAAAQAAALKGIGTVGLNAAAGITGLGLVAAKMSADFEQSMLRLRNNTVLSTAQFQQMRQTILELGKESGAPLDQLAQGARHISDYGIQGANATNLLRDAMKAAVATGSEVGDTAQLIARILTEYGISADHAGDVTNKLWLAVAKSDNNFKQMVDSGGQAFAMAAKLGVSFDTTAAVLSVFAKNGITVAQSGTQMRNMLNNLTSPAKHVQDLLEAIHQKTLVNLPKDFTLSAVKGDGLAKIFADIQEAAKRLGIPVADLADHLFPGIRSKIGALIGTSNEGLVGLRNLLQELPEATKKDPIDARYLDQIKSASQVWKQLVNAIIEDFLPAGKKVTDLLIRDMPIVRSFIDTLAKMLDGFTRLPGPIQQVVFGLGALRIAGLALGTSWGLGGLTGIFVRLVKELKGIPAAAAEAGTAMEALSTAGAAEGAAAGAGGGLLARLLGAGVGLAAANPIAAGAIGVGAATGYLGARLSTGNSEARIAANDRPLLIGTIQGLRGGVTAIRGTAAYDQPMNRRGAVTGLNQSEEDYAGSQAKKLFGTSDLYSLTGRQWDELAGKFHELLTAVNTAIPKLSGADWKASVKALAASMGLKAISEYRPGAIMRGSGKPSLHALGQAIDFAGTPSQMDAFFQAVQGRYAGHIRQLLYSPDGQVTGNRFEPTIHSPITRADHYSHVHVALSNAPNGRNSGGPTLPGSTLTGGGGIDWNALVAKAQKKQDFTTALTQAQIAAMPDGEQKEIREVMEQFRQKRLDAMKNFSAAQANRIIKDLNVAQTQAVAGVRQRFSDEDQQKALQDWKNVQQVAAQAADALKTTKGTLTQLYEQFVQGNGRGAQTGSAGLYNGYQQDIRQLVQQRTDTIRSLPAALSPANRSHAISRLYDIFGGLKGNRLTQYNQDLSTFNAQYGYGGTQDQDFYGGLVSKLTGGLQAGLSNLPGSQDLPALQNQLAELQKLQSALPPFATEAKRTMDLAVASLKKAINDQELEETKAAFKAYSDKQQTAFDLMAKYWKDWTEQAQKARDFVQEWQGRVAQVSGNRGENHRTRLQNEAKAGLNYPTTPYASLPADVKSQVDQMVDQMISGEQRGKLRDFWRATASDAQRSLKGAGTGFFESILSGQANFKTSLKNLFGDVRLIAARALSNVLVENMEGAFKSLFGGGANKKNVGDALDDQAKGISRKGGSFQSSLGNLSNVLNQGSGLLAGAIGNLIASLSGGGKKKHGGLLGGLIGAAVGFFTGGPAGAIAGAISGSGFGGSTVGTLAGIGAGIYNAGGFTPPISGGGSALGSLGTLPAPNGGAAFYPGTNLPNLSIAKASSFAVRSTPTAGSAPSGGDVHFHIENVNVSNEAEKQRFYSEISRQFRASRTRG